MARYTPSVAVASFVTILTASAWGLLWIPIHVFEGRGINGVWTLMALNLVAFAVLLPLVAISWHAQRTHAGAALRIGIATGLGLSLYGLGLVHTSVVRATLLFYLTPVWATLIGIYVLGERGTWQRWGAICLGFVGLGLMVSANETVPLNVGDAIALASGVVWAIGATLIAREGAIPVLGMVTVQFFCFALFVVGVGMLVAPVPLPGSPDLRAALPTLGLIAVFALIPGVALLFWAQQFLSAGRVGILMMSEVLVAIVSATILLPDERMGALQWAGAVLIIAASLIEVTQAPSPPVSRRADR